MAYAQTFNPPDLPADAGTLRHQLENALLFQGLHAPANTTNSRLVLSFLLTADKASREYISGCNRMREQMANGGTQALAEAVGAFENCINATKRSLRLMDRLGRRQDGVEISRHVKKLAQNAGSALTDVRDGIEHIDADIVSGEGLQPGDAHMLMITKAGDALEIGSNKISFVALCATVKALNTAGSEIINCLLDQSSHNSSPMTG